MITVCQEAINYRMMIILKLKGAEIKVYII